MATIKAKIIETREGPAVMLTGPVLDALNAKPGTALDVEETGGRLIVVQRQQSMEDEALKIADEIMDRHESAFKKLAR